MPSLESGGLPISVNFVPIQETEPKVKGRYSRGHSFIALQRM